ncbi:receptor-type tyrosine-protein phosphatase C precursor [Takifugu rubripes]|uniref:Receptor-type tyrosine-protein phosphatase C n=1 Tax=Takifugu rubripes TaxID=31033 RepID=Q9I8F1_TAKRU|nr:receptor-type tyrosine-protein phosphatase C precursor [Takifugu rubripes]CAB96211.1 CD45 [Takifugu rubripes]|eukprot:NP_001027788.1 receptor-type tyrosine-protein phosphatase C precursor [Takifugu rubripes]
MAGYFGLNILLWAGIVTLASSSTTSPALTTHASTVTEANVTLLVAPLTSTHNSSSNLSTNLSLSSTTPAAASETTVSLTTPTTPMALTNISAITSSTNATSDAPTQPPAAPQCSYTLKPIPFGFRLTISNFTTAGLYNLTLQEQDDMTETTYSPDKTSLDILDLKPCTSYRHWLSLTLQHSAIDCNQTVNTTATLQPKMEDFQNVKSSPGSICYQSKWNIRSLLTQPNNMQLRDDDTFCIRYDSKDICTNFTKNVSTSCGSFPFTKFIDLVPSHITMRRLGVYPEKIETTFPPNCKNWTVEHVCSEKGSPHQNKSLTELEPYTDYSCAAVVTRGTVSMWTEDIDIRINCNLLIYECSKSNVLTNTSMNLHWNLTSSVCKDLFTRFNFSYNCYCDNPVKGSKDVPLKSQQVSCSFSALDAFEDYTCGINVKYKKFSVLDRVFLYRTEPGIPERPPQLHLDVHEHNQITVKVDKISRFNGPSKFYIVRLYEGKTHKETRNGTKPSFVFKDLSYSTEYTVQASTFNGHFESSPHTRTTSTFYNEPALINFLIFLIIVTSVALILVAYKIYVLKRKRSRDTSESMILIPKTNDEEKLIFVEPLTSETLLDAYKRKIADEGRLFLAEFQSIPRIFSKYTVKEAKKSHNVPKNRYVDILPYDYNRVQLTTGNGSAGCDYINASFIDGFKELKKYIAAQGPKEETVSNFWRMIWEQQTSIIVMVSRCEEGNRIKCAQYWPSEDRDTEIFEEFIVKLTSEDHYPDYIIRHLSLTNKKDKGSEREVTHIQFMSWPDHGVPEEAQLLLKLRRRVNSFKNFFSGPIVVHCSAGVGRTGTYIGIDAMMESLEAEGRVDIYGYVVMLRRQRCLMVQVEAQYILIHQALLEHTQFGETENTLQELHSTLNTLKQRSSDNEPTLLEDEFERLPNFKNWRTFNTGVTEENKKKNRTSSVIPYDYNRVLLKLDEEKSHESDPDPDDDYDTSSYDDIEDSAKYINASLLSGYWGPHTFISAQTPLPDTVADFWSMILQKRVSIVVMLSDCSQGDEDCVYWGEDKKTVEDIEVETESTDNSPNFILRNMMIHHLKTDAHQQVKHFQFLKWGDKEVPEKPQDLADLIKEIKHRCGYTWPRSTPIIVHCNDGSSRSGAFCALWNLLDNAEKEKMVDVFQVVKTLRKERQGMCPSLEQYQFLYDALEVVYPVQNGDVKAAQNSVQIVNETAEQQASTTRTDHQEAEEGADGDVSTATGEKSSTVTVEV